MVREMWIMSNLSAINSFHYSFWSVDVSIPSNKNQFGIIVYFNQEIKQRNPKKKSNGDKQIRIFKYQSISKEWAMQFKSLF